VDAAIEGIERRGDGFVVRAAGTTWPGRMELEADEVIVATGFRTPLEALGDLDVATVADGRVPAQTPFWESVSAPGIYFAGNATQGSPGMSRQSAAASSTSVNGFRYNARVLVRHIAEKHFGLESPGRPLERDDVVPFLLDELAHAPELWIQKGYLARAVSFDERVGARDEGILPLTHVVDAAGPPAVAAAVELDANGTIVPVVYVVRNGRADQHILSAHPLRQFDGPEQRAELEALLNPLLR
jgi:hypothetical protein